MDIIDPDKNERIIKKTFGIAVAVLLALLVLLIIRQNGKLSGRVNPDELHTDGRGHFELSVPAGRFNDCRNYKLGVKFQCDFGWEEIPGGANAVYYRIAANPAAGFRIIRFDIDIVYIQQLSRDRLETLGQYAQGFAVEDTKLAGFKAIKVKAFSKKDPETRLLDYYFVRDEGTLYALMFSVSPKARWDDYKFIFQKVVDNFTFI